MTNQKKETKNISVAEIQISPVIEEPTPRKPLAKQISDTKFDRKTTSRVITNKSSSDFDIKKKNVTEDVTKIQRISERSPEKPRHITTAKIKIEPVTKKVPMKIVIEDKIKTSKAVVVEPEPESDVEVTTITTTTTKSTKSKPVVISVNKVTSQKTDKTVKKTNTVKKTDEKRPVKCVTTKTITLTSKPVIISDNLDNVIIDTQQAKSSREPTPNKMIPVPVSPELDTGKPRYPDNVQEPDEESPKRQPKVNNIPIYEEATSKFVGLEISEVTDEEVVTRNVKITESDKVTEDDESLLSVTEKVSKFVAEAEKVKEEPVKTSTLRFIRQDVENIDEHLKSDECLLSVSDKVTKFISTAEETKKIKTSTPFTEEKAPVNVSPSDECLMSLNEKVSKFSNTTEPISKITTSHVPQKSPELVKNILRQTSKQEIKLENLENYESPKLDRVPVSMALRSTEAVKKAKEIFENKGKPSNEPVQRDILSRPSIWEDRRAKASTSVTTNHKDVKLQDIGVFRKPEEDAKPFRRDSVKLDNNKSPTRKDSLKEKSPEQTTFRRDSIKSFDEKESVRKTSLKYEEPEEKPRRESIKTPSYIKDAVSSKKDLFEKKISSSKLETSEIKKTITSQISQEDKEDTTTNKKFERSMSRDTSSSSSRPGYMSHTVCSLEHRRDSVNETKFVKNVSVEREEVKHVSKFGVELKRTDSFKQPGTRRKSSCPEIPHIEEVFDLELLEKMLETVTGRKYKNVKNCKINLKTRLT